MKSVNDEYGANGVALSPQVPRANGTAQVFYNGLLVKDGATDVYARVGFGQRWKDVHDYKMSRASTGFEVAIPIIAADTLHVCFKDCANHWDNNSGKNYSFDTAH